MIRQIFNYNLQLLTSQDVQTQDNMRAAFEQFEHHQLSTHVEKLDRTMHESKYDSKNHFLENIQLPKLNCPQRYYAFIRFYLLFQAEPNTGL